jgi:CheY-like chemotaxis protein
MDQTERNSWEVILAEDDKDDVLIFELAVTQARILINMRHAVNGDELFRLLKESLPDIIFLDISMPCKDGVTCVQELRKNPEYDSIPVIMYTSYNSAEKIETTYRAGANFYLLKGGSIFEIAENLKKIFSIEWKKYMYYPPKTHFTIGG